MAYFNLNFVTNPPNDELVNEETQLNDNWEEIATKLNRWNQQPSDFGSHNPPIGTEALYPVAGSESHRVAVYNGSTWSRSVNDSTGWLGWTALGIRSPRSAHPSYPPKYNVNVLQRRVELCGAIRYDSSANPWPTSANHEITSDTAIPLAYTPLGNFSVMQMATSAVTTASSFATAAGFIQPSTVPTRISIFVQWHGNSGGGNYISLDGYTWWY